jgi:hypothetical protein
MFNQQTIKYKNKNKSIENKSRILTCGHATYAKDLLFVNQNMPDVKII